VPGPLPVFTAAPPQTTAPTTTSTTVAPTTTSVVVEPGAPDPDAATGLGDSRYPELGNTGYDVDHYTIELVFDPLTGAIEAVTTVEATADEELEVFSLDFVGFDITELTVDGADAASTRSGGELVIAAPTVIPAGEGFTVAVAYEGLPTPWQTRAMGLSIGWQTGLAGEQYVVAEPDAARTWVPANDHPLDTATFTFLVTVPEPLLAVSNGVLVDTRPGPDGITRVYEMEQPMATYLATVVIGDYTLVDDAVSSELAGFPVRNVLPPDRTGIPPAGLELHGEMVQFLEELLGPYPFDLYGIAIVPDFAAALENSTLSIFGTIMVDAPNFESILMHELAHQWFGNHVTLGDWGDL
jgi:aminopeptidase N